MIAKADHCEFQISISAHAENSNHVSTNAPFQKIYYGGQAEVLALLKVWSSPRNQALNG